MTSRDTQQFWTRLALGCAFVVAWALLHAPTASAQALVCDDYAGDPAPNTQEWTDRDANNVACGYQRHTDAQSSPAFLAKDQEQIAIEQIEFATVTAPEWAAEPNRQHANCCTSPQSKVGDPFRSYEEWAASGRGRHVKFYFINNGGAKLRGRMLAPNDDSQTYPAVTFTPGLQSYNEVNSWFPQGLAEAGYVVMIIDPQGQGDSENCGHAPDGTQGSCPATNQPNDTRSAIDFILSTPSSPHPWALGTNAAGTPSFNPYWESVDPTRVGIAGHSLGAIAVTPIGQEDLRVGAIVSYDNLDGTLGASVPRRTPSLFFYTDYAFPATPVPKFSNPNATQHFGAYTQLVSANVDVMSITTRASDHYEWGYQPYPANFPSSRYGERVAFYYTLAWFDRYLKDDPSGTTRLTRGFFDASSDQHSIGAGTYDPVLAASDPGNPFAGNVPYTIEDKCVANLLSFYYDSAYRLEGGALEVSNMRALGCPDSCGDGVLDEGESCDDGNELSLDGCSAACAVETCYACLGAPSTCLPNAGASCDDGSVCTAGDVCSPTALCSGAPVAFCVDTDGDGVEDDQDNCLIAVNPGQEDNGGINTTTADGIGDACQCGDVTGNGIVNGQDGNAIKRHGLGITPNETFVVRGNCDVSGNGLCNGQDGNAVKLVSLGSPSPLYGQNCQNADPDAPVCTNCGP